MKFSIKSFIASVVIAAMPVLAVPTLRITDVTSGITLLTVGDQSGLDTDSAVGSIGLASPTPLGSDWSVRLTGASTKPFEGTSALPQLFMQSTIQLLTATPRTLRIEFSETGFDGNPFQGLLSTTTNARSGAAGTVGYGASIDSGDVLFGGNNNYLALDNTLVSSGNSYAKERLGNVVGLSPFYSLSLMTEVTFTSAGTIDVDAVLSAVPEPGFYGALAIGLSGLFAAVARRRRNNAASE